MPLHAPSLAVLPGTLLVLFLVRFERTASVLAVRANRFLDGLRAANDLLTFSELHREEQRPEDLLPWTGNV